MFKKYYPFDPKQQESMLGPTLRYNSTSYEGDSISIYSRPAHTSLYSEEDIYVSMNKFNPTNALFPIECSYFEQRQSPILPYKSLQYKLCMASVHIPENSIQLFNWDDKIRLEDGTEIDKYVITVEYNNGSSPTQESIIPLEFVSFYKSDEVSNIKRVYSIDQCLQSLNSAFARAYTILAIPGSSPPLLAKPPKFYLDTHTGLINFLFDYGNQGLTVINESDPTEYQNYPGESWVRISFNYNVYMWFSDSFPNIIPSGLVSPIPLSSDPKYSYLKTYQRIEPDYNINLFGTNYWNISQTHNTTALFSNVSRILITSNIDTRPIYTSYIEPNQNNSNPSSMNSINILGDFHIENFSSSNVVQFDGHSTGHQWKDILTEQPLRTLSFNILALRNDGSITQVLLSPGKMASVKLIFSLK